MRIVTRTIKGARMLGNRCRRMMRLSVAPTVRAATTYSFCRTDRTDPRTTRVNVGTEKIATAMMTLFSPGPMAAMMAIASSSPGKASRMSISRMTSRSAMPP